LSKSDEKAIHTIYIPYTGSRSSKVLAQTHVHRIEGDNYRIIVSINKDPLSIELSSITSDITYVIVLGIDSYNNKYRVTPILIGPLTSREKEEFYYYLRRNGILYYKFVSDKEAHFLTDKTLKKIIQNPPKPILEILKYLLQNILLNCSPCFISTGNFSRWIKGIDVKPLSLHYKLAYRKISSELIIHLRISKNKTSFPLLNFTGIDLSQCRKYHTQLLLYENLLSVLQKDISKKIPVQLRNTTMQRLLEIIQILIRKNLLNSVISQCQKFLSKNERGKCINLICKTIGDTDIKCLEEYSVLTQFIALIERIKDLNCDS